MNFKERKAKIDKELFSKRKKVVNEVQEQPKETKVEEVVEPIVEEVIEPVVEETPTTTTKSKKRKKETQSE